MSTGTTGALPKNYYPELPQLAYQKTSASMQVIIDTLKAAAKPVEVKRASYVMVRIESGNGAKGINNNYIGAQADSARWSETPAEGFAGTVTFQENGTHRMRIFLAFKTLAGNLDFLTDRVLDRGVYVGGRTHKVLIMDVNNAEDLVRAYCKEWVHGSATAEPDADTVKSFLSIYHQATTIFT